MAGILNEFKFSTPASDGDAHMGHISSHYSPALLPSAQDHEGQPSKLLTVKNIWTTSESIISATDMDTTNANSERLDNYCSIQPQNPSGQLHESQIFKYLIKKTGELAEHLLKDLSLQKAVILAIVLIVLYQLCTSFTQVNYVIE